MKAIKQELDTLLNRCLTLHGTIHRTVTKEDGTQVTEIAPRDTAVREFIETLAKNSASDRELADKIIAAWDDKTGKLQRELSAARIEQTQNFIASESNFRSMFFETISLGPEDQATIINNTRNEMRISEMGDDGTPEKVRVTTPQEVTTVGVRLIASDIVRVKTLDLYRGDVSSSARATINTARDLRIKIDRLHYNLLNAALASGGCYGAFSYEQARTNKATRIYVNHSVIDTSHLPTTNLIVNGTAAGGTGGTRFTVRYYDPVKDSAGSATSYTGFRQAVLLAIIDYAASWGDLLPDAGDSGTRLVPTGEIIVPSSDVINIALTMMPVTNMTSTDIQNQIAMNGYFSLNLLGMNWRFIPDVTIPAGTCYPRFNLMPGISFEKPNWHREFVKTDDIENYEERWQRATYSATILSQRRPRAMKITYIAA